VIIALPELEQRKAALETDIAGAPASAPRLHPNLAKIYRQWVANLQDALADPATQSDALEILRGLIERVTVVQAETGFAIELTGEIANMVKLASALPGRRAFRGSLIGVR
jgi:site-specific DNA recombinase